MHNPYWLQAKTIMANRKPIQEVEDKLPPLPTIRKKEKQKDITHYEMRNVNGHVEVYEKNVFQFSADNEKEAREIFYNEDF